MFPLSDGLPARRFPVVNVLLIAANFAVWIFYELPHLNAAIYHASFYPCTIDNACSGPEPWGVSWITAMFLHGGWDHILGNMLFLAIFGKNVEDALGSLRYLVFYFAGGFAAMMTQTAMTLLFGTAQDAQVPELGASGAIAAVLGAYFVLYPSSRVLTWIFPVFLIKIPAWIFLGAWFAYQLIEANFGLFNAHANGGGVAFFAHVGGFIFGLLAARLLARTGQAAPGSNGTPRRSAVRSLLMVNSGSAAGVPEGRDPVASSYVRVTGLADLFAEARQLSVRTMIVDVEPLVAPWRGSQESLDQGIARVLGEARAVPSVRVVVFATNSARRPSAVPACDGLQVSYLASADKPLRTAPYRDLPRPGAVAGDQLPTDGILAYRLGFTFLHYTPELTGVPLGPGLMHRWGELMRPVLFRKPAADR